MAAASVSASAAMAGSRRAAGGCSSCRATVAAPHRHQSDCWGAAKVPARRKAAAATAAAAAASSATERLAADEGTVPTRRLSSQEVGARPVLIACFAGFGLPLSPPSPVPAIRLTCATTQHLNPRPPATPPCPAPPPGHRGAVREPARAAAHRVLRRVLQQRPGGHRHRPRALCRAGGCGGVGGAACCCCCWWGGGMAGGLGGGARGGAWRGLGGVEAVCTGTTSGPPRCGGRELYDGRAPPSHPPTLPPTLCACLLPPRRILDDVGGAFGMGAVGGGLWHLLKGMRNSPSGHRFVGGIDVRGAPPTVPPPAPGTVLLAETLPTWWWWWWGPRASN